MDTKEDQTTECGDQREEYKAPTVAILGKVEDLTHGGTTAVVDTAGLGSLL